MKDSRRNFIKKLSLMGAATLTLPQILAAKDHEGEKNAPVSKTFLFQGDSITDGGRSYNQDWNHIFGQGYVYLITSRLNFDYPQRDYKFFNRGISGHKLNDPTARWQTDALDIKPDLLSILVGINDIQGVIVRGETFNADDFGNHWIWDGLHPMPAGHELIAREWIKAVTKRFRIL